MPSAIRRLLIVLPVILAACAEAPLPPVSRDDVPRLAQMLADDVRPDIGRDIVEGVRLTGVAAAGGQVIVTTELSEDRVAEIAQKTAELQSSASKAFCPNYARFFAAGGSIRVDMKDRAGKRSYSTAISACPRTA